MSNPSETGGAERLYDRRHLAKKLERSNFSQTCNLLSQFLKEKRSLPDLSDEHAARKKARDELVKLKPPATTIILPKNTDSADASRQEYNAANKGEFRRPPTPEPATATATATAQMTIFYAGKVIVYNDFPNDRAKEIIALASKGGRSPNGNAAPASTVTQSRSGSVHHNAVEKPSNISVAGGSNIVSRTQLADLSKPTYEQPTIKPLSGAKNSELPIARRTSLHRFLEKRKDRAVARAPPPMMPPPAEAPCKASGSSSGGEAEAAAAAEPEEDFPGQLDLNL